jgi:hypothetical protein
MMGWASAAVPLAKKYLLPRTIGAATDPVRMSGLNRASSSARPGR